MRVLLFAASLCGCGGVIVAEDASPSDGGDEDATPTDVAELDASADVSPLGAFIFQKHPGEPTTDLFWGQLHEDAQQASVICSPMPSSGCVVSSCDGSKNAPLLGAGTVTVFGGTYVGKQITPDSIGQYTLAGTFNSHLLLGVSASGGQVPAFGLEQIRAPGPIILTSSQGPDISTSDDLTMTWTGGEVGAQVVLQAFGYALSTFTAVTCTFDATTSSGTIPQALLAALKGSSSGALFWGQMTSRTFVAGSYPILLGAIQLESANASYQ